MRIFVVSNRSTSTHQQSSVYDVLSSPTAQFLVIWLNSLLKEGVMKTHKKKSAATVRLGKEKF
jgi:hypothetical protein